MTAGILFGVRSFAPMFGFALGAWTNSLYVDLTGKFASPFYSRIFELLVWYLTYLTVVFLVCSIFSKCDLIGRYIAVYTAATEADKALR